MRKIFVLVALSLAACSSKEATINLFQSHAPKAPKVAKTSKPECKKGDTQLPQFISWNGGPIGQEGQFLKCSSDGKWIPDPDAQKAYDAEQEKERVAAVKEEEHRKALEWALRTRVITDNEMKEVEKYGESLVCPLWGSSWIVWGPGPTTTATTANSGDPSCTKILNDDLFQQMRLRAIKNGELERNPSQTRDASTKR